MNAVQFARPRGARLTERHALKSLWPLAVAGLLACASSVSAAPDAATNAGAPLPAAKPASRRARNPDRQAETPKAPRRKAGHGGSLRQNRRPRQNQTGGAATSKSTEKTKAAKSKSKKREPARPAAFTPNSGHVFTPASADAIPAPSRNRQRRRRACAAPRRPDAKRRRSACGRRQHVDGGDRSQRTEARDRARAAAAGCRMRPRSARRSAIRWPRSSPNGRSCAATTPAPICPLRRVHQ